MSRMRSHLAIAGLLAASALAAVGCGSSAQSKGSTTQSSTSQANSASASVPFSGPESTVPHAYPTPKKKAGFTFKLGYLNPQAGIPSLDEQQAGATAVAKSLGGSVIAYGVQENPQTQVADFKLLLAQHVNAILFQPLDPKALQPLVTKASAAGIPIITSTTPADAGTPNIPGYTTDVLQGTDHCAYGNVKAVAQAKPHATYAMIGVDLPFPALQDLVARTKYWAAKFGLKYVGSASTGQAQSPASGSTAMSAVLARWPNVNTVFTWYDGVAEGAATLSKSRAGGHIMIVGNNGEAPAVKMIQSGTMFATCREDFRGIGEQQAIAAYDALTKQHRPLPAKVVPQVIEITKGNA